MYLSLLALRQRDLTQHSLAYICIKTMLCLLYFRGAVRALIPSFSLDFHMLRSTFRSLAFLARAIPQFDFLQ